MHGLLGGEVVEQVGLRDAGGLGDLVEGGAAEAVGGEDLERGGEDRLGLLALDAGGVLARCGAGHVGRSPSPEIRLTHSPRVVASDFDRLVDKTRNLPAGRDAFPREPQGIARRCRTVPSALRTTCARSGCPSPPTGSSSRRRGCSWRPRACTTRPATGGRCWTGRRASGAATPGTAGRGSPRRSPSRRRRWTMRRRSRWGTRRRSSWRTGWSGSRRRGWSTRSSPTPGRESVETALKIAIAYQRAIGQGTRTRLIGRERGYHGVNFGGISVGGIVTNRKFFGTLLTGVDHLPHTHLPAKNAFSKGQPEHGAELADELERIVALHDASTIAAVIVEPVAGSTGVLVPPKGYLERLREICTQARDPADLRRGDHRVRADGRRLRRREVRGDARHDHLRQGADQRGDPDGRGADDGRDPRRVHDRARASDRALPRLYLFGEPDRGGGGAGDAEVYAEEGLFERAARWRRSGRRRCIR